MADLIDRNALEPFCESGTDPNDTYADMTFIRAEHIENAPAVNRWIPCSERLPEKHVEVLAYSPYWGKIVVAMWGGEFWLEQWTDDDLEQSEISHWMPLPEPPKEDET